MSLAGRAKSSFTLSSPPAGYVAGMIRTNKSRRYNILAAQIRILDAKYRLLAPWPEQADDYAKTQLVSHSFHMEHNSVTNYSWHSPSYSASVAKPFVGDRIYCKARRAHRAAGRLRHPVEIPAPRWQPVIKFNIDVPPFVPQCNVGISHLFSAGLGAQLPPVPVGAIPATVFESFLINRALHYEPGLPLVAPNSYGGWDDGDFSPPQDVWWQLSELQSKVENLQVSVQIDPLDVMETLYGVDNKLSSQFALMEAKMEKHGELLGSLWCSASHYKSAIDLLEEIRSSHRKLNDLVNLVDNKILSDAWKDVSPPAASVEPPETPAMNDHTLPFVDRFLADVVLSLSAAEILSTCGYRRTTKKEDSAALTDIEIQSCLDFGIRRGDYCKPFRVQSWMEELLSVKAIRPVPSNTFQGPEQDVSAAEPLPVPERHDSAVVSASISGDSNSEWDFDEG